MGSVTVWASSREEALSNWAATLLSILCFLWTIALLHRKRYAWLPTVPMIYILWFDAMVLINKVIHSWVGTFLIVIPMSINITETGKALMQIIKKRKDP